MLDRISKLAGDWMVGIACLVILAMMLHIVADVFGKFFFNFPVEDTLEIVEIYYMVAVVYLPFAYVARGEGHIIVELFTRNLAPRNLARLETVIGLATLVVMVVLTWKTGEDAVAKTILGEIREAGAGVIIAWPSRWLPPFGCGVMAVVVALRLIADARLGFGPDRREAGDVQR